MSKKRVVRRKGIGTTHTYHGPGRKKRPGVVIRLLRKIPHFALRNSTASIYFSGENLFTITKYSGMDPECGGFDTMTYPVSRVFALGVKINY